MQLKRILKTQRRGKKVAAKQISRRDKKNQDCLKQRWKKSKSFPENENAA